MLIYNTLREYAGNFTVALSFLLLLVFVLPFLYLEETFAGGGTILLDYNFLKFPGPSLALAAAAAILFLFLYSVFVTLMVIAVRRDLSKIPFGSYLGRTIQQFSLKYFAFIAVFSILVSLAAAAALFFSAPPALISLGILALSLPFLFLAQSITIDEASLKNSIKGNFEFIRRYPTAFLQAIALGFALTLSLPAIEFAFDYYFAVGRVVSILFALVFVIPFFEAAKTELYMHKYDLVRSSRSVQAPVREVKKALVIKDISKAKITARN